MDGRAVLVGGRWCMARAGSTSHSHTRPQVPPTRFQPPPYPHDQLLGTRTTPCTCPGDPPPCSGASPTHLQVPGSNQPPYHPILPACPTTGDAAHASVQAPPEPGAAGLGSAQGTMGGGQREGERVKAGRSVCMTSALPMYSYRAPLPLAILWPPYCGRSVCMAS